MLDLTLANLRKAYADGTATPRGICQRIREQARASHEHCIWITLFDETQQEVWLSALEGTACNSLPLWGIPFAIKDNIDMAGIPTTAACEAFTYTPDTDATLIRRLLDAGAIPVGKANLDQFATGLNGTRSPWGACRNAFDPAYVSGGSSAGSAVSVALGQASFSLGTDTAGSGRVPAGFNNLIGLKPSRGLLPTTGVLPACRSLDCVSVLALNTDDADAVLAVAEGHDPTDGYSRMNPPDNRASRYGRRRGPLQVGVLQESDLQFFGDDAYATAYRETLSELADDGMSFIEIDYTAFNEVALQLYEGPWVSERYLATQPLIDENPEALFPVVRAIIEPGGTPLATSLFRAEYRLHELRQRCLAQLQGLDCLLTPTAGRHFTIEEMLEEPILRNSQLGYYTNFVNLLDLAAVSVPSRLTPSGRPFGITLVGPTFSDRHLLSIANRIQHVLPTPIGATGLTQPPLSTVPVGNEAWLEIAVCGAHLSGLPLNAQLTERGAELVASTHTAPCYRLHALPGGPPHRPALAFDANQGAPIEVEVWRLPIGNAAGFIRQIPRPLGIGRLLLADGSEVAGFICEAGGLTGATDITEHGGWRQYLAAGAL